MIVFYTKGDGTKSTGGDRRNKRKRHSRLTHDIAKGAGQAGCPCTTDDAILVAGGKIANLFFRGERIPALELTALDKVHLVLAGTSPLLLLELETCTLGPDNAGRNDKGDDGECLETGGEVAVVEEALVCPVCDGQGDAEAAKETLCTTDDGTVLVLSELFLSDVDL
jgi:hypothetical protein